MPMRHNAFGDAIAQPGTDLAEIENIICDKHLPLWQELVTADLFTSEDEVYKFGGTLYFSIKTEDDEGEDDFSTVPVEYDGFETLDEARDFVLGLGLSAQMIMEES